MIKFNVFTLFAANGRSAESWAFGGAPQGTGLAGRRRARSRGATAGALHVSLRHVGLIQAERTLHTIVAGSGPRLRTVHHTCNAASDVSHGAEHKTKSQNQGGTRGRKFPSRV